MPNNPKKNLKKGPAAGKDNTVPAAGKNNAVPAAGKDNTVPAAGKDNTVPAAVKDEILSAAEKYIKPVNMDEDSDDDYEDLFKHHPHLPGFKQYKIGKRVDHHSEGPKSLQAFVLAGGGGSRMTALVPHGRYKPLLPICNFPMVYYPLARLQEAGFIAVVLLTAKRMAAEMRKFIDSSDLTLKVQIVESPDDQDLGAVDAMRLAAKEIKDHIRDIVIVSCDVISDVDLLDMVRYHRMKDCSVTMLVTHYDIDEIPSPPGAKTPEFEPDIFIETPDHGAVMVDYLSSGEYGEDITMDPEIQASGSTVMCTDKIDAHFYIIRKKLLKEYILSPTSPCKNMKSFKSEVLPHLMHLQFDLSLRTQEYVDACLTVPLPFVQTTVLFERTVDHPTGDLEDSFNQCVALVRSYYHEDICVRANTPINYWMCNRTLTEFFPKIIPSARVRLNSTQKCAEVGNGVKVKGRNLFGEGTSIGEGTTITDSMVGPNVKIGKNCSIEACLLYGNIQIADETTLSQSMICCTIDKPHCTVTNSIVANSSTLLSNSTIVDETLIETEMFSA